MKASLRRGLLANGLWLAGLATLVCALAGRPVFVLFAAQGEMAALAQEVDSVLADLRRFARSDDARASLPRVQSSLDECRRMIESESNRIAALSTAARDDGVKLLSLSSLARDDRQAQALATCSHRLTATGTYRQIAEFLEGLHQVPGLLGLDELSIEHFEGGEPDQLRAAIKLTWFGSAESKTPLAGGDS